MPSVQLRLDFGQHLEPQPAFRVEAWENLDDAIRAEVVERLATLMARVLLETEASHE
jgi:hypothetical protein